MEKKPERRVQPIERQFRKWQKQIEAHVSFGRTQAEAVALFKAEVVPTIEHTITELRAGHAPQLTPRQAKTRALVSLLKQEFEACNILTLSDPTEAIAVIAQQALNAKLQGPLISRRDRVFAVYRHLHAYAEGLKPYGAKSRKAGEYREWLLHQYGLHPNELIRRSDMALKRLQAK